MDGDLVVINFFALVHLLNNFPLYQGHVIRKSKSGSFILLHFRKDGALQSFIRSVVWWLLLMLFRIGKLFAAWEV